MSGTEFGSDLSLTPSQEGLLRTALSSNQANSQDRSNGLSTHQFRGAQTIDPEMHASPIQTIPGSGSLGAFNESPFLDYENLDDGSFDVDFNDEQLFGDLPGAEFNDDSENHDKRKASNDEEGDGEASSKRREGDDKSTKKSAQKPGRKPLTAEPTTKRKAQNRAAQRAFRERKERHLKDLETKVEDLEKASENANHENGRLRATVEKLSTELKEYRKRLSLNVSGAGHSPPQSATQSRSYSNNGNDFSFAFPKFGDLPGSYLNNGSLVRTTSPPQSGQRSVSSPSPSIANELRKSSTNSTKAVSPTTVNGATTSSANSIPQQAFANDFSNSVKDDLSGLFSPSILEFASRNSPTDYMTYPGSNSSSTTATAQKGSFSSANSQSQMNSVRHVSSTSLTGSPESSMSHALDSSNGTTPESSADSPDNRKGSDSILNTINEESQAQNINGGGPDLVTSPAANVNGFDWMAQQNGGQFDPVLFGDYRDPQDNILNTFGDYFNDAFPLNDFANPYNTVDLTSQPTKKDFMKDIEVQRDGSPIKLPQQTEDKKQFVGCDALQDRVRAYEKANPGETDMDDLCSQLKSKAKCSQSKGAVIEQKDVDDILGPAPTDQKDLLKMFT
ncbi:DNA-binding transcription factor yap1 [Lecanora helva]